jgi:phospholipase A1
MLSFSLLIGDDNNVTNQELLHLQDKKFLQSIDDLNDTDAEVILKKRVRGLFGLKPYEDNYLLPFAYREGVYTSYNPSDVYKNIEAEMQISLQYDAYTNLFGLDETYSFSYTQKSMWQIYTKSSPFRETNYNPEFFISFPIYHSSDTLSLKMLRFSISHQSNGQGNITKLDYNVSLQGDDFQESWVENRSRSWNYATAMAMLQHKSLFIMLKGWYRFKDGADDDNPDLIDYLGHGEMSLYFPYNKALMKAKWRQNFITGKGAIEGSYSYPFANQENVYWYAKIFSGYGETLIDYNNYITKFALGFSFSR